MRALPSPLLVVTDRPGAEARGACLSTILRSILAGGARWVWFRERDMPPEARAALARDVLDIVRRHGGALSIGGDVALAVALGADGVHLPSGWTAAQIDEARECLSGGLVGLSAHTLGDIEAAARAGADYATLSPIFPTASKPGYGPALGSEALTAATAFGMPVIALGGITVADAMRCRQAGAAGVAVMGGLMRNPDPGQETRALLASLGTTHPAI